MFILISLIFMLIFNIYYKNIYANNLSYFLVILNYTLFYLKEERFFLRFFPLLFSVLFYLTGIFINENCSLYLTELARNTNFNGSLPLGVLAHMLPIFVCYVLYKKEPKIEVNQNTNSKIRIINILLLMIIFLNFLNIFFVEKPIWNYVGLDRFLYLRQMKNPILGKLVNIFYYFLAIIVFFSQSSKIAKISIFFYISTYVMMGHKFGAIQNILYVFALLASVTLNQESIKMYKKKILFSSSIFIFFAIIYSYFIGLIKDPQEYFIQRLAQQGQIWSQVFPKKEYHLELNEEYIKRETDTFYNLKLEVEKLYDASTYQMMKLVTPQDIYIRKIERGSRYSGSTQASILFQYNWLILIYAQIILGIIYYLVTTNLLKTYKKINFENMLKNILYMRLLFITRATYEQSDFYKLFSIEVIVIVVLLFSIYMAKIILKEIRRENGRVGK